MNSICLQADYKDRPGIELFSFKQLALLQEQDVATFYRFKARILGEAREKEPGKLLTAEQVQEALL